MALLAGDSSAQTWLPVLVEAAPRSDIFGDDVRRDPGRLLPELAQPRDYLDRILARTLALPRCFEHSAPPSRAFLRWLLENPERLRWPERKPGVRMTYGAETQRLRKTLLDGSSEEQAKVQAQALAELDRRGPDGSRQRWWAFEGHTEVDCWLETERLLLFVEGKRFEPLSASTHWYPERNQLVRNLEVVGELSRGRAAAVLLVSEEPLAELTEATLAASTPHLDALARKQLSQRYGHPRRPP